MLTESSVQSGFPSGVSGPEMLKVACPSTVIIFGATGDLTARKLLPALYKLSAQHLLPDAFSVIGVARRPFSDEAFRDMMKTAVAQHSDHELSADALDRFAQTVHYQQVVFDDHDSYHALAERIGKIETHRGVPGQRVFYLATASCYFMPIIEGLQAAGLIRETRDPCAARVVIEKPFGHDLRSAIALNHDISKVLHEDQVYRIDHYLGKETVLNILSFRFGNAIFEPLFNNKYVDHVQITVAESLGMEGRRGPFYESAGALRDVVQNHGLQLLSLAAMEPPAMLTSKGIRDEKVKVLQSLKPVAPESVRSNVIRGQYTAGMIDGRNMPAYREEDGVDPRSSVETYVGLCAHIDNWRWADVPFYFRTGKCLPTRLTEIAVQFKQPPLNFFTTIECVGDVCDITHAKPNVLVFRIQPDEGINLSFSAKRPGMLFQIHPVRMEFLYNRAFDMKIPEAYERLLLDALRGDSTLFMRSDEVESAWRYVQPIMQAWSSDDPPPLYEYAAGTWGPQYADQFMGSGRVWRNGQ